MGWNTATAEDHWKSHTEELGRWNGRQIRNAFSIAASLAHFDAEGKNGRAVQLRQCHFQEVEKATVLYDKYRHLILTASDGFRAKQSEARNNDFNKHTFTQRGRGAVKGNNAYYPGSSVQNTPSRAQGPYEQRGGSPLPPLAKPMFTPRAAPEPTGFSQAQQVGYNTPQQKQHGLYSTAHAPPPPRRKNDRWEESTHRPHRIYILRIKRDRRCSKEAKAPVSAQEDKVYSRRLSLGRMRKHL
ncbi:hypothetical protein INS49_000954 [Diaporthe citri]|uniref:uncharacterized protein n=1 Tax=Diaporthe citri TaxID=83186 RepID=UPI001C817EC2|nr:uncharacterized protein INS49_000954 [Diaporthe citri]KAG6366774.1 hypothetical protein INS49_000954 [Diaporthe citri]